MDYRRALRGLVGCGGAGRFRVAYRPDVYHRSVDHTDPTRSGVMLHVSFRHRDASWGGYQAWPFRGFSPELTKYVQQATPPAAGAAWASRPPGHPYWDRATLRGVQARYAGLDMSSLAQRDGLTVRSAGCGEPGATSGQGICRSAARARSRRRGSRWWPARTCRPTGRSSKGPARKTDGGAPVEVRRRSECGVVHDGAGKADLVNEVTRRAAWKVGDPPP